MSQLPSHQAVHMLSPAPAIQVSIVIVSWNVIAYLQQCLDSIAATIVSISHEVIIVDNLSSDETVAVVTSRYPWVKLIANQENVGFARGNNQGFAVATGEYVLILNPDTIVHEGAIQAMLAVLKSNPAIGIVGPYTVDGTGGSQYTCARRLPTLKEAFFCDALRLCKFPRIGSFFHHWLKSPYDYAVSQEVEAISGSCMMIERALLLEIGGFGEDYIHGGEDIELCYKARQCGRQVYYAATAQLTHFGGRSSHQVSIRTAINARLSQADYFRRNISVRQAAYFILMARYIESPITILIAVFGFLLGKLSLQHANNRLAYARAVYRWNKL